MADLHYYLTPWRWVVNEHSPLGCWEPPEGRQGWVGVSAGHSFVQGTEAGLMLLASDRELPDEDLLGKGDLRELKLGKKARDHWESKTKHRPAGDTVADWLADQLTEGSDPDGLDAVDPLVPTTHSDLEIWLPGHGQKPIHRKRFDWGDKYTNRMRRLIRRMVKAEIADLDQTGSRRKPVRHVRQMLDDFQKTYPGLDWQEIVPAGWVDTPLPKETEYTADFTAADGTALSSLTPAWDINWGLNMVVQSNEASTSATTATSWASLTSDVSSSNNQAYCVLSQIGSNNGQCGPVCRMTTATCFGYMIREIPSGGYGLRVEYLSSGSMSLLGQYTTTQVTAGTRVRIKANGTSITGDRPIGTNRVSVTNNWIASGTRGGIYLFQQSADRSRVDDFKVTDDLADNGPASGPAAPVLFNNHYLSQGMR